MDPYLNLNNTGATNLTLGKNDVQEATVISNAYSGQYGQQAGAQIYYVTKSGTNQYHGNASTSGTAIRWLPTAGSIIRRVLRGRSPTTTSGRRLLVVRLRRTNCSSSPTTKASASCCRPAARYSPGARTSSPAAGEHRGQRPRLAPLYTEVLSADAASAGLCCDRHHLVMVTVVATLRWLATALRHIRLTATRTARIHS